MRLIIVTLILILCGVGTFAACHGRQQNAGLPLVHASFGHEFVCVPSVTPKTGPVKSRRIA